MDKNKLIFYLSILVMGEMFLPIFFKLLPFPLKSHLFWQIIWWVVLLVCHPKIYLNKLMITAYLGIAYYYITSTVYGHGGISNPFFIVRNFIDITFVSSFLIYYVVYAREVYLLKFSKMLILILLLSAINTVVGLFLYPEAVRFNPMNTPYSVEYGMVLVKFYNKIGIQDYGFFYGLAISIPVLYVNFKVMLEGKKKNIVYLFLAFLYFVLVQGNYATAFLLGSLGIVLSLMGRIVFIKYRLLIILIVGVFYAIPKDVYVEAIYSWADAVPAESALGDRIFDIGDTLAGKEQTHANARLDRIPLLLDSFKESPFFGTGFFTGHNFLFDVLSAFGLIGLLPFFLFYRSVYRFVRTVVSIPLFFYFQISFVLMLMYATMKAIPAYKQNLFLFAIVPILLRVSSLIFERNKNE